MKAKLRANRPATGRIRYGLFGIIVSTAVAVFSASSAANAQTSNAGASNSPGPVTIRVGGNDAANGSTPIFVALRLGYFKDAGLDVKYVTLGGGAAPMAAALRAGEIDVAVAGALQHMTDMAKGILIGKIIGEITQSSSLNIIAANGVTDIKQLKGKVFGISSYNGGDQLYAQALIGHFGLGPDDVTFLPIGVPASRIAAMMAGSVDATTMPQAETLSLPDNAKEKIKMILSGDDSPVPFISGAIFAGQGFLASNKPALQRFLAAIGKGSDWLRAHPTEGIPACQDSGSTAALCKLVLEVNLSTKDQYTWTPTTRVNADGIKAMIPIYSQAVPQMKNMTVGDFVDASLAAGSP